MREEERGWEWPRAPRAALGLVVVAGLADRHEGPGRRSHGVARLCLVVYTEFARFSPACAGRPAMSADCNSDCSSSRHAPTDTGCDHR